MTIQDVYQAIKNYLNEQHPHQEIGNLAETDNLFDLGLLTSLTTFELITFLEELQGHEFSIENYSPHAFQSIHNIFEAFFAPQHS